MDTPHQAQLYLKKGLPMIEKKMVELPSVEELKKWIEESMGYLNPEVRPLLLMGVEALYVKLGGEKFLEYV